MLERYIGSFLFLEGFVEGIRTDGTTRERMPRDGTVFQLTSNVMRCVQFVQLLQCYDVCSTVRATVADPVLFSRIRIWTIDWIRFFKVLDN